MDDPVAAAVLELTRTGGHVLVGVSGGMDSVALLHALAHSDERGKVAAAHVNYGLRGEASDADEALVRDLCARWGVRLAVRRVRSAAPGSNRQAWARRVRYDWFRTLADRHRFGAVATAHHRDDQAETILLKLLRGAGPDRLGGMKPARKFGTAELVRPLLHLGRDDVRAYAERHGLDWREDASNASEAYDRTHVRALLRRSGGSAPVARTASLLERQYADLIEPQLRDVWSRAAVGDLLLLEPLRDAHPTLRDLVLTGALRRLLGVRPTQARIAQVAHLIDAQKGKYVAFGDAVAWREETALRFVRRPLALQQPRALFPDSQSTWNGYLLNASEPDSRPKSLPRDSSDAWLAAGAPWPLTLRQWKAGDTLRTLGGQTKSVSDVLTDHRVQASERSGWPVVCAGDTIVWVPGVRRASAWLVDAYAPAVRLTWRRER